ncbi:hypothetical protein [Bittarella massiliensis (ex Durand et al. 2017)]|uniref:hypothetical protein n=1 Tax=Bittarella massiliensis (ex Durand et al. 2017) TaxID=1720313 RepID=UPI0012B52191|nr:hypothetical protein [Bittarella massiliensis (ex Durand et al. 2017)]
MNRLCYWKMRGMGWWYLPPLIALWLVLPGMLAIWYHQDPLLAATSYLRLCEQVIPLFSVWWLVMARKEELTGDGRELLYIYGGYRGRLGPVLFTLVWYLLHAALPVAAGVWLLPEMGAEHLAKTGAQVLFVWGLCLLLMELLRSLAVPLLLCAAYCFGAYLLEREVMEQTTIFFDVHTGPTFWPKCGIIAAAGLLLAALGCWGLRRMRE